MKSLARALDRKQRGHLECSERLFARRSELKSGQCKKSLYSLHQENNAPVIPSAVAIFATFSPANA